MDFKWIIHKEIKQEKPEDFFLISSAPEEELNVAYNKYPTDVEIGEIARTQIKQELSEHTELVSGWSLEHIKEDTDKERSDSEYGVSEKETTEESGDSDEDWCDRERIKKTKSKPKFKFANISIIEDITSITTTGPPYSCTICSISFPLIKCLEAHSSIHKGKKFQCDICRKVYRSKDSIHGHMKLHMEKQYTCPICGKAFALKKSFMHHQLVHEEKKYRCDTCSKLFRQKGHLTDHMKVHRVRVRRYKCEICELAFYEQRTLNKHIRNVHSKDLKSAQKSVFRCPNATCGKYYTSEIWFKMHTCGRRRPQNESTRVCTICKQLCENRNELKRHFKKCHTIKPENFKCHRCNRSFNYRFFSSYVLHVAQNCARDIVYTCDYCEQLIPSKTKLFDHFVAVHDIPCTGQAKPCPKCGKLFFNIKNLNYHLKKNHLQFKCEHCNKMIRSKGGLTLHLKRCMPTIKVKSELHECDICKDSFVQETHLLEHMTEIHSEDNLELQIKIEPNF